jgi:hypothetical protein
MAFNDVFLLIAVLAAVAFVLLAARWLYFRRRGTNTLAEDVAALQKMRQAAQNG